MQATLTTIFAEIRGAWRYRWYALFIAWLILLAGSAVVYLMPNEYKVTARFHVNTESMLGPLLKGLAVTPDLQTRVQLMTRTLLSRSNLEQVAAQTDLDLAAHTQKQKQTVLDNLNRKIRISSRGGDIYTISYENNDPKTARNVVRDLLNILMETSLGTTQQDSNNAQAFLHTQLDVYNSELNEAESKLAQFKKNHVGLMPSQGSDYYSQLQSAQQDLGNLQDQLQLAQNRRATLRNELNSMQQGAKPEAISQNPQVQSIDQQLQADQSQLNNLLLKYTNKHPDVIAMRSRIQQLKKQRSQLVKQLGKSNAVSGDDQNNPVYQKTQIDLNDASVKVHELRIKIHQQERHIANLKSSVDELADVQAKLSALTRNYNVTKKQYDSLLERLNTAQLSEKAQNSGNQLKFQVIDPPIEPAAPAGPHRHLFLLVVLIASIGAGGAFGYFLHLVRPVFMTRQKLAQITGYPVIGSVTLALTPARIRVRRMATTGFALVFGMLLVTFGAIFIFAHTGHAVLSALAQGYLI